LENFADKFESEQELHDWLISFYEKQLQKFLNDIGGTTEYGVKITPRIIKVTMNRYSQLLEKNIVTDW
jgi:hypothetical protein